MNIKHNMGRKRKRKQQVLVYIRVYIEKGKQRFYRIWPGARSAIWPGIWPSIVRSGSKFSVQIEVLPIEAFPVLDRGLPVPYLASG
jgi:hypothetical protein